ncbi:hypothetical protein [Streptomyces sp. NBC_00236]|nr:hypothetical protein [Streptomyces sp. NBC_00236]
MPTDLMDTLLADLAPEAGRYPATFVNEKAEERPARGAAAA